MCVATPWNVEGIYPSAVTDYLQSANCLGHIASPEEVMIFTSASKVAVSSTQLQASLRLAATSWQNNVLLASAPQTTRQLGKTIGYELCNLACGPR